MKGVLFFISCLLVLASNAQKDVYLKIDSLLSEWENEEAPGFAIGIIKDSELVYAKGYGSANLDYNIPNTPETVFRIASTSKQFTAACIVLLEQQGKISFEDSLTKFFSEFPAYANKVTIEQLLHHTSGVRDYLVLSVLAGMRDEDYYTDEEIMDWLVNQKALNFYPGSEHTYSNSGYWLLGRIVEQVTGISLGEFAQKHIFTPLKMTNTHFHDNPGHIVKKRAIGYSKRQDEDFEVYTTTLSMTGDGGVFTTIQDFKLWVDEYYTQSHLDKAFWDKMTTVGKLNNGKEINYACGLMISKFKGLKTIGHSGSFVGYLSSYILFPDEKLAFIVLTNRNDISPATITFEMINVLLKDKFVATSGSKEKMLESIQLDPEELAKFTGIYELEPGVEFSISVVNDSLMVLQKWNGSKYPVIPIKENTFGMLGAADISFKFEDLKNGAAEKLVINQNGQISTCNRKTEIAGKKPDLKEFVGSYYSKELLVSYKLSVEEDTLICNIKSVETLEFLYSSTDTYAGSGVIVRFLRKNNIVTGFMLDAGRVKGIVFIKE